LEGKTGTFCIQAEIIDKTGPVIMKYSPPRDAMWVDPETDIVLTFDDQIIPAAGNRSASIMLVPEDNSYPTLHVFINENETIINDRATIIGNTLTIRRTAQKALVRGQQYSVIISNHSLEDRDHNLFLQNETYRFTVQVDTTRVIAIVLVLLMMVLGVPCITIVCGCLFCDNSDWSCNITTGCLKQQKHPDQEGSILDDENGMIMWDSENDSMKNSMKNSFAGSGDSMIAGYSRESTEPQIVSGQDVNIAMQEDAEDASTV